MEHFIKNKFSIGLNLDTSFETYSRFIETYHPYLSSIYYSMPWGKKYYSREALEEELTQEHIEEKLSNILNLLKKYQIRRELTFNMKGLTTADIDYAIEQTYAFGIIPEEIVSLKEYGSQLRHAFPDAELKYSFNNTDYEQIPDIFDTVVVGKHFLRDQNARHELIRKGFQLVLLLNNGCSFNCHGFCGDRDFCHSFVKKNLERYTANELYAMQSFFPFELKRLLAEDPCANDYRYKISNRPLGLDYTIKALSSYLSGADVESLIQEDIINYSLFGVMYTLGLYCNEFDYQKIVRIKKKLSVSYKEYYNREHQTGCMYL